MMALNCAANMAKNGGKYKTLLQLVVSHSHEFQASSVHLADFFNAIFSEE